jgi:hypothetical protein
LEAICKKWLDGSITFCPLAVFFNFPTTLLTPTPPPKPPARSKTLGKTKNPNYANVAKENNYRNFDIPKKIWDRMTLAVFFNFPTTLLTPTPPPKPPARSKTISPLFAYRFQLSSPRDSR